MFVENYAMGLKVNTPTFVLSLLLVTVSHGHVLRPPHPEILPLQHRDQTSDDQQMETCDTFSNFLQSVQAALNIDAADCSEDSSQG